MFEEKAFHSKNRTNEFLKYFKYLPKNNFEKLPLIIYIHGAGSRGNDLATLNTDVGPLGEIKKRRETEAVIVSPQCHSDTWFEQKKDD